MKRKSFHVDKLAVSIQSVIHVGFFWEGREEILTLPFHPTRFHIIQKLVVSIKLENEKDK